MSQQRIKIRTKKRRARGPKYWVAVGTLAAYTTLGGKTLGFAQEVNKPSTGQSPSATERGSVLRFDITPGTLGDALAAYTQKTGIVVLVRDDLRSVWSPGVTGLYTSQRALEKLLAGTGIS